MASSGQDPGSQQDQGLLGKDSAKMWLAASKVSYIGIFFGLVICIGFFGGKWLDGRFRTTPWLSITGLLIGVATGFRELIRIARRVQKEEERNP